MQVTVTSARAASLHSETLWAFYVVPIQPRNVASQPNNHAHQPFLRPAAYDDPVCAQPAMQCTHRHLQVHLIGYQVLRTSQPSGHPSKPLLMPGATSQWGTENCALHKTSTTNTYSNFEPLTALTLPLGVQPASSSVEPSIHRCYFLTLA